MLQVRKCRGTAAPRQFIVERMLGLKFCLAEHQALLLAVTSSASNMALTRGILSSEKFSMIGLPAGTGQTLLLLISLQYNSQHDRDNYPSFASQHFLPAA